MKEQETFIRTTKIDLFKKSIPWWGKIIAKIILSRMPLQYRLWEHIGLFCHGNMNNSNYAISTFQSHFSNTDFINKNKGFSVLELGNGDSVASAIIANTFGASQCYMVDVGKFASDDFSFYQDLVANLCEQGFEVQDLPHYKNHAELLTPYGGIYLTNGLESLRSIPDNSVDFIWSQAVLEHIPLHEFDLTMMELRRILRKGGVCSHQVDLKDHLGGA